MFLQPLGLFALAALPVVLFLHLFRRRFRPHRVSALFLWEALDASPASGRRRERLRRSSSLWLELAAALALALCLAGPRGCSGGRAEHLVCVLDASASMGAVSDGTSFRDRAVAEVLRRVRALPARSRVTLITSGARPRVLAGPAAFPRAAVGALEDFAPSAARHDLEPALGLALQLAGEGRVLLVTDDYRPEGCPESVGIVALGRPVDNVGWIEGRRSRPGPDGGARLSLRVQSFSGRPQTRALTVEADGAELLRRELALEPGEKRLLTLEVPADLGVVTATLAADGLAIDDALRLAPPPPRTLGLGAALAPETVARLGLARGDEPLGRLVEAVPDAMAVPAGAGSHLLLTQGAPPADTWSLVVRAPGEDRVDAVGPFLTEKRHPLLRGVTFEGVVWSASPSGVPGAPLVSAGSVPLCTEVREGARRTFHLNLDPRRSTLQRSPDWPILLSNLCELRRDELPGPEATSLVVGETLRYRARASGRFVLDGPDGARELEGRDELEFSDLATPGLYTLRETDGEQRELCTVALNFADARESDLSGLRPGERDANAASATLEASFTWIEALLAAAALIAVCADWFVTSPRAGRRSPRADGRSA